MPSIYSAPPTRIAVGHLLHFRCPSGNVIRKLLRNATRSRTLRKLEGMLSEEGGYFEHIPTTAFVLMSLLVILRLQYPYTGSVSIQPDPHTELLQNFCNRLWDSP